MSIELECGATAYFDESSGTSYICSSCLCVVGSVSMPKECKDLYDMIDVVNTLKGTK